MNKTLKLIAIVTIVFGGLLAVWANGTVNPKIEPIIENSSSEAPKLYVSNCARCHGANGKGQTALGQSLDVPDLTATAKGMSVSRIKNIIVKGKGSMPAFGKKLKAADVTALTKYVRSL